MSYYSKVIAAVVGLIVLIAARYGLDLGPVADVTIEAVVGSITAYSVYRLKNKPTTEAQVDQACDQITEANKAIP